MLNGTKEKERKGGGVGSILVERQPTCGCREHGASLAAERDGAGGNYYARLLENLLLRLA